MNKNKIILGVFALVSVLAIALGFAAAFGEVFSGKPGVTEHVKDQYDLLKDMPESVRSVFPTVIASHINFAWIGGIITGVLGILGLGAAGFVMFKGIELNQTLMIVVLVAVATMMSLAIAAIVTQGQLNSETWMMDQFPKTPATTA